MRRYGTAQLEMQAALWPSKQQEDLLEVFGGGTGGSGDYDQGFSRRDLIGLVEVFLGLW